MFYKLTFSNKLGFVLKTSLFLYNFPTCFLLFRHQRVRQRYSETMLQWNAETRRNRDTEIYLWVYVSLCVSLCVYVSLCLSLCLYLTMCLSVSKSHFNICLAVPLSLFLFISVYLILCFSVSFSRCIFVLEYLCFFVSFSQCIYVSLILCFSPSPSRYVCIFLQICLTISLTYSLPLFPCISV